MKVYQWICALAVPAVVLLTEGLGWWWMHPNRDEQKVNVPVYNSPRERLGANFSEETNKEILTALGADRVYVTNFKDDDYYFYRIHDVQWNGATALNVSQVLAHRPEVCYGAAGVQMKELHDERHLSLGDMDLVFDVTEFGGDGPAKQVFVYKMPWIDGFDGLSLRDGIDGMNWLDDTRMFRINAVKKRFQPRFARVLMVNIFGVKTEEEAWARMQENVLPDLQIESK